MTATKQKVDPEALIQEYRTAWTAANGGKEAPAMNFVGGWFIIGYPYYKRVRGAALRQSVEALRAHVEQQAGDGGAAAGKG